MTPTEVASLVREIVEIDQMAVDDNFFDVGGNSILALVLISRIKHRTATALRLIDIVHSPTPEGIARLVAQAGSDLAASGVAVSGATTPATSGHYVSAE
jgi:aryl carrier-like protein